MNPPDFARAKRYFGRDDFWPLHRVLRAELEALGQPMTYEEWYGGQLAGRYYERWG